MRITDESRRLSNIISRAACLGRLKHKNVGYSGPLNRQLFCFSVMASVVRSSLRDLIEVVLATMLLNGDVDRDREDWAELGLAYVFFPHPFLPPYLPTTQTAKL